MDDKGSILDRIISQQRTSELTSFRPFELKKQLFSLLKSREEEVINKRFGLSGKPKMTLEAIGKECHVTRERIRQIEIIAIKKLAHIVRSDPHISTSVRVVRYLLEPYGGIREEYDLLTEVASFVEVAEEEKEDVTSVQKSAENFFLFCLNHLWAGDVVKINEDDEFHRGWKLPSASLKVLQSLISEAYAIIERAGAPLDERSLTISLRGTSLLKELEAKHVSQVPKNDEGIVGQLRLSKRIAANAFNEWGIAIWPSIYPKRMGDKIHLVLKHHGKPMHFREIAEKINETKFDYKKAYPPTIHNELILDKRYVLVGRGIYALTEWGYYSGTVQDVIVRILKEKGAPMSREDIVREVLKQRMVHEATINLALTNKKLFTRAEGRYALANP